MHLVCAGFHHEIKDAAGGLAIFGAHAAGFDLELLQSFRRRTLFADVSGPVSGGCCAIDKDRLGEVGRPDEIVAGHSRHELRREAGGVAAAREAQRQIHDLPILERLAHRSGVLLEHIGVSRHRNRFRGSADLESCVDAHGLRNTQLDIGLDEPFQAVGLENHFVLARRQVRRRELTGAGRRRLVSGIVRQVADADPNAGHDGAGRIRDGPRNGAAFLGDTRR